MSCDCSRRVLLKGGGLGLLSIRLAAGGLAVGSPTFLERAAAAAAEPGPFGRRKVLVALFQRGAMDGLAAVSPTTDEALRKLRPRLYMSASRSAGSASTSDERLIDLDIGFALHPSLAPLDRLFREERLAIVHAVGSPDATRSHFDAQDYMETATPGRKGTASGWLNRVSGLLGHEATPFRNVSLTSALPRSFYGDEPAIAVTDLADFKVTLPGTAGAARAAGQGFEALYEQTSQELLRKSGSDTFEALAVLSQANLASYRPSPGVDYPNSSLGSSLRQIAQLIKSEVGLEVAFAESGGWDTHVGQGTASGSFANRARDLARSIDAFWTDLGSYQDDVVLMTMTEFGRTVAENGSGGTDHGHGSCMFVLGHGVAGGQVHGDLPKLAARNLYEGRDLPVTTDFRSVFAGVAGGHLGIENDAVVFPGWQGKRLRLYS